METAATSLYARVGEQLIHFSGDVAGAEVVRRHTVTLPSNVQYVWPHPARTYFLGCYSVSELNRDCLEFVQTPHPPYTM